MKVIKIRTTVEKSNPQLIRELNIDGNTVLDELRKIIGTAYGIREVAGSWKTVKGVSLGQNLKVCDRLNKENSLILCINPTQTVALRDIRIFVDFVAEDEIDENEEAFSPEVTYLNGYNLFARAESIKALNRAYFTLGNTGGYVEISGRYWAPNEFKADIKKINNAFSIKQKSSDSLELDDYYLFPTMAHLNELAVTELKSISNMLGTNPSRRKAELVEDINLCYGSRELLLDTLSTFTYEQYIVFRNHFTGQSPVKLDVALLQWRYLFNIEVVIIDKIDHMVRMSDTFAQTYQQWLKEAKEEHFFAMKQMSNAIKVSCYLYGYCNQMSAKYLYTARYATEFSEENWLECTDNIKTNVGINYSKTKKGLIFLFDYISKDDAEHIQLMHKTTDYEFYIPSKEEFEDIVKFGIYFNKIEMNKIRDIIERDIWSMTQTAVNQIRTFAYYLTLGMSEDDLIEKIQSLLWYDFSKNTCNSLKRELKTISKRLPKVFLKGNIAQNIKK